MQDTGLSVSCCSFTQTRNTQLAPAPLSTPGQSMMIGIALVETIHVWKENEQKYSDKKIIF